MNSDQNSRGAINALLVLCLSCFFSSVAIAVPAVLLDEGKLALKVWVEPQESIVVSQQVNLYIEVATHRWFTGGTKIGLLEIDGAVVLRRDTFAVNSSRRMEGENWAVQLWTLTVYPQREGVFSIPEIPIIVTVSGEDDKPVTGIIHTESFTFNAVTPPELKNKPQWLATPLFNVEETYNKDLADLHVGDVLQRTILLNAENMAAMMLPELKFEGENGLSVYQKAPVINDKVNRGDYLAERTESISYVVEKSGEYNIPALTFYWWDLSENAMKSIELPSQTLLIASGGLSNQGFATNKIKSIVAVALAALIIVIACIGGLRFLRRRQHKRQLSTHDAGKLKKQFVEACNNRNFTLAVSLLYQWLDYDTLRHKGNKTRQSSVRQWLTTLDEKQLEKQFNRLMETTYSVQPNDSKTFEGLLEGLDELSRLSTFQRRRIKPIDLRLN